MTDLDASTIGSMLASDSFQLTFCFCLFGFFGTIISTSWYLHWSSHQKINDFHKSDIGNKLNIPNCSNSNCYNKRMTNYKYPHYPQQQQHQQQQQQQQILIAKYHGQQVQLRKQEYYPLIRYKERRRNLCSNSTQIILDWDDTLFPTAYTLLNLKNGITSSSLICDSEWNELNKLVNIVLYILMMFIQFFGAENIVIVTNARMDWFNESCKIYKKLFGQVKNLLINKYGIAIISAHDQYSRQKSSAFMDLLQHKYGINKVLCFGDSNEEYDAIHNVCSALNIREKNVSQRGQNINYYRFKLMTSPSLNCMIKQLNFIKKLDYFTISKQSFNSSYHFK